MPLSIPQVGLIILAIILALLVTLRADLTRARGGKILAFIALFLLPSMALWSGYSEQMELSKSTQFCLSCHVMTDFGRSLWVNDPSLIPAAHFQNNRIPRGQACFTCHTNYTMFGGINDKLRGLHHVYVQYLGTIPRPEDIRLYTPFNNRECLHCHAGARSFLEAAPHHKTADLLTQINENKVSCVSSGCHDTVHDIVDLKDDTFWKEPQ